MFEYLPPAPRQAQPAVRVAAPTAGDTLRLLFPPPGAGLPAGALRAIAYVDLAGLVPLAFVACHAWGR